MGRPLGPIGGRGPGGGGTGLPEGLRGGRVRRSGGAAVSGACAAAGAWVAGACAAGAWAGEVEGRSSTGRAAAAAGARSVGRLLIRRDGRAAGASAPASAPAPAPADAAAGASSAGDAATLRAGAFLAGAVVAPALDAATAFLAGAGASAVALAAASAAAAGAGAASAVAAAFFAGAAFLVALAAFLAGAGSSGWTGRRNPSASALRRTRSACASSMEDEWLLTPIPRERASSSPSLLVRPSSLASS
jgi:hypothetical protein